MKGTSKEVHRLLKSFLVGGGWLKSNIVSVPVPLRGLGRPDGYGTGMGRVWDGHGTGMGRVWDG